MRNLLTQSCAIFTVHVPERRLAVRSDPRAWLTDVLARIGEQGGIVLHGLEQPRLDLREPPRLVFDERGESWLRDAHTIPERSLAS